MIELCAASAGAGQALAASAAGSLAQPSHPASHQQPHLKMVAAVPGTPTMPVPSTLISDTCGRRAVDRLPAHAPNQPSSSTATAALPTPALISQQILSQPASRLQHRHPECWLSQRWQRSPHMKQVGRLASSTARLTTGSCSAESSAHSHTHTHMHTFTHRQHHTGTHVVYGGEALDPHMVHPRHQRLIITDHGAWCGLHKQTNEQSRGRGRHKDVKKQCHPHTRSMSRHQANTCLGA